MHKRISHFLFKFKYRIYDIVDCCHKSSKSLVWYLIINAESDVLLKDDKFIRSANNDMVFIDEATSSDKLFTLEKKNEKAILI